MPITDLTGTTWVIDDAIDPALPSSDFTYNINFTSNNNNYTIIKYNQGGGTIYYRTSSSDVPGTPAYYAYSNPLAPGSTSNGWQNQAYRTITITGGTDVTNSDLIVWLTNNATLQVEPESDIILQKTTLCMKRAVPDLTGTTWTLNDDITEALTSRGSYFSFDLNFTNNTVNYTVLLYNIGSLRYQINSEDLPGTQVYFTTFEPGREVGWQNQIYKTITITGGEDATNLDLINFLEDNATLVSGTPTGYRLVPVSVMRKVSGGELTDLTGTTWLFNDVPSTYSSTTTTFNLNFKYGDLLPSASSLILTSSGKIVYRPEGLSIDEIGYVQTDASWTNMGWGIWNEMLGEFSPNTSYKTIQITGGTDATNSNLITYLQQNATLVSGGSSDTLQPVNLFSTKYIHTFDITTTISNGTYTSSSSTIREDTGTATVTLSANSGYVLPDSITVTGASYTYNSNTGVIDLSNAISNVTISAICEEIPPYLTFSSPDTFTLNVVDNKKYWNSTLQYSTDTSTWNTWDGTTTLSSTQSGTTKYLYLRGTGNTRITGSSASSTKAIWILTGSNISCNGNIENLLDYQTVANGQHPTMANYCYFLLFQGCSALVSSPMLPATTLTDWCYGNMFQNCSNLSTISLNLPATTTASSCYRCMFYNCTSLTTAPDLPATSISSYCYYRMFYGCSSLTTAPHLSAENLADYCFSGMFYNCTSLTQSPQLPIVSSVPQYCYYEMFYGCSSLTTAPELPVTTLAPYCYSKMFYQCTSLTTAPDLPATTLADYCYNYMFYGCTSLTTPAIMAGGTTKATEAVGCCQGMYNSCTALNIYTTSSGHTPFYVSLIYFIGEGAMFGTTYAIFYNCYIDGVQTTTDNQTSGVQYYY